jgi:hypothetical protein
MLRRVYKTIVAVENQYVLYSCVCVCVRARARAGVWVSACMCVRVCFRVFVWGGGGKVERAKACYCTLVGHTQAPYFLGYFRLHHIFRLFLINGAIFGKKLLNIKCVLIFSTTFIQIFLIVRIIQRVNVINVETSSCKVPVIFVGF